MGILSGEATLLFLPPLFKGVNSNRSNFWSKFFPLKVHFFWKGFPALSEFFHLQAEFFWKGFAAQANRKTPKLSLFENMAEKH